ncbi:MAG TPA: hypothetical protein VGE07_26550 [Herpetosiphonaceae bacterium]
MNEGTFRFSVEELTYLLAMSGFRDEGRALLAGTFDEELNDDQLEQRMLTAAHSLMAREMMAVGGDGSINLEENTAALARVLVDADYSFRFSKAVSDGEIAGELAFSIHHAQNQWIEHTIEQGVVHQLSVFNSTERLIGDALSFLEPPRGAAQFAPFDAPGAVLEVLTNPDAAVSHRLRQAGVPADLIPMLSVDASEAQYQGSIMLVEYDENRSPVSNHGALLLQGPERLWLLRPTVQNGETIFTVLPGSAQAVEQELRRLLSLKG